MEVNLLETEPCPAQFLPNDPLMLSLRSLQQKLESILTSEGFKLAELAVATLSFAPAPGQLDDYCTVCKATFKARADEPVECVVNYLGQTLGI